MSRVFKYLKSKMLMRIRIFVVMLAFLIPTIAFAINLGDEVTIKEGQNVDIGNWNVKVDAVAASGATKASLTISHAGKSKNFEFNSGEGTTISLGGDEVGIQINSIVLGRAVSLTLSNEIKLSDRPCKPSSISNDFNTGVNIKEGENATFGEYVVTLNSVCSAVGCSKTGIKVCRGSSYSDTYTIYSGETEIINIGTEQVPVEVINIVLGRSASVTIKNESYTYTTCSDSDNDDVGVGGGGFQNTSLKGTITISTVTANVKTVTSNSSKILVTDKTAKVVKRASDFCTQYGIQEHYCTQVRSFAKNPIIHASTEIFPPNGYHCSDGKFVKNPVLPKGEEPATGGVEPTPDKPTGELEGSNTPTERLPQLPQEEKQKTYLPEPISIGQFVSSIVSFFSSFFK